MRLKRCGSEMPWAGKRRCQGTRSFKFIMQSLAVFDRCFSRPAGRLAGSASASGLGQGHHAGLPESAPTAQAALAAPYLISPWGEAVAPMPRLASAARILRAAYGVRDGDWFALLADEALGQGTQQAWALALWRGAAGASAAPQWLSPALLARPGQRPNALRDEILRQAVQALWQQGWRLQEAFSPDWH